MYIQIPGPSNSSGLDYPLASTLAPRERPYPFLTKSQPDKSPSYYSEMKKKFVILLSISLIVLSQDGRSLSTVILYHEGLALRSTPSQAVVTQLAVLCFQRLTFKKGRLCIGGISDYV